jgi:hypothetical protein
VHRKRWSSRKHVGYFLILKRKDDKVFYLRWSYEDKPVISTLPASIIDVLDAYKVYCNGNETPCLFRARIRRVWRDSSKSYYDIALDVMPPDMITKLVNYLIHYVYEKPNVDTVISLLQHTIDVGNQRKPHTNTDQTGTQ